MVLWRHPLPLIQRIKRRGAVEPKLNDKTDKVSSKPSDCMLTWVFIIHCTNLRPSGHLEPGFSASQQVSFSWTTLLLRSTDPCRGIWYTLQNGTRALERGFGFYGLESDVIMLLQIRNPFFHYRVKTRCLPCGQMLWRKLMKVAQSQVNIKAKWGQFGWEMVHFEQVRSLVYWPLWFTIYGAKKEMMGNCQVSKSFYPNRNHKLRFTISSHLKCILELVLDLILARMPLTRFVCGYTL